MSGGLSPEDTVAKGPLVHCLDELSKRPDGCERLKELQQALIALRTVNYRGLEDVFARHLIEYVYGDARKVGAYTRYLRDYWFDATAATAEFVDLQPIAPTYAEGVIKTLDLSLEQAVHGKAKPIDAWWIVDQPRIEMVNLVNDNYVTLLVATPRPKRIVASGIWNERAHAWSTAKAASGLAETRRLENRPSRKRGEQARTQSADHIPVSSAA